MSVHLDPFTQDAGTYAAIGTAFSVTLGKMLDAGRADAEGTHVLPYVRAANIQDAGLDLSDTNSMPFTAKEASTLDLRAGDVLVVEGGAVGTCVVLDEDMPGWSFQKTVNRLRPTGQWEPRYVAYVLRAYRDTGVIDIICNRSTIPHLTAEKLRALRIPAWAASMQRAIADYLDRETAQIDALIAEQERLLGLLRERRLAVATAVVGARVGTGERLKWMFNELDARAGRLATVLPLMSVSISWGVRRRDEATDGESRAEDLSNYKVCRAGDLVINRMRAFQGALGLAPEDGVVSPDYAVLAIDKSIDAEWLAGVMKTADFVAEMAMRVKGIGSADLGSARTPRINLSDLGEIRVAAPAIDVQKAEARRVQQQVSTIDVLIAESERFVALIRERRAALITSAVTGQIDVRGAVA